MKTIGKIALLAVTLFAFGATVQAQDVGQKNTTGRVIADKIIMYIPNRIVDFFDMLWTMAGRHIFLRWEKAI